MFFFAGKLSFEDYVREIDYDEEEEEEQGLDPDDEDWTTKKSAPPKKKKRKGSPHCLEWQFHLPTLTLLPAIYVMEWLSTGPSLFSVLVVG